MQTRSLPAKADCCSRLNILISQEMTIRPLPLWPLGVHGMEEVEGSSPSRSTNFFNNLAISSRRSSTHYTWSLGSTGLTIKLATKATISSPAIAYIVEL